MASQPLCNPDSTRAQVPSADQRRCRLYAVFQLPYEAGRSRHGDPVRVRHSTPSITSRCSFTARHDAASGRAATAPTTPTAHRSSHGGIQHVYQTRPLRFAGHALAPVPCDVVPQLSVVTRPVDVGAYAALPLPHGRVGGRGSVQGGDMAEHLNIAVLRHGYEAFAAGDMATVRGLWTEDVTCHVKGLGKLDVNTAGRTFRDEF